MLTSVIEKSGRASSLGSTASTEPDGFPSLGSGGPSAPAPPAAGSMRQPARTANAPTGINREGNRLHFNIARSCSSVVAFEPHTKPSGPSVPNFAAKAPFFSTHTYTAFYGLECVVGYCNGRPTAGQSPGLRLLFRS